MLRAGAAAEAFRAEGRIQMITESSGSGVVRIALFYDGTYFSKMSTYYKYQHQRKEHLTFTGCHEYIRHNIAEKEKMDVAFCQIVEAHFFRGRFSLTAAKAANQLEADRFIDQLLMYAGIVSHYYPMNENVSPPEEKGIDVWLALEAYDMAVHKRFDVLTSRAVARQVAILLDAASEQTGQTAKVA
jgi:hypothetical protein